MATCVVSGNLKDVTSTVISGAIIKAVVATPFLVGTTLVVAKEISTTSDSSGNWSLTLQETASVSKSIVVDIEYPDGATGLRVVSFGVIIPNAATANFSDLITT